MKYKSRLNRKLNVDRGTEQVLKEVCLQHGLIIEPIVGN
ncbi:hypothetical protein ISN44_As04g007600 [Arabidopsis suecica]|uniref:Uncharacterized protein n=1 Tax=Arabidopsis suecica TaxID=45249 RepID=A0A8T2E6C2_ARASU|nr:hypothetical protein ISN44_As04g007600 [Arabidopsis suecica]